MRRNISARIRLRGYCDLTEHKSRMVLVIVVTCQWFFERNAMERERGESEKENMRREAGLVNSRNFRARVYAREKSCVQHKRDVEIGPENVCPTIASRSVSRNCGK